VNFVLITPAKNEEMNLPKLAECIANQTILPSIWVILDDSSTDRTPVIIKRLEQDNNWIKGVQFNGQGIRDLDEHFGEICNYAFQAAITYCDSMNISIDYLVKVDADIILPKNCMEKVMQRLDKNKEIGIISPHLKFLPNASIIKDKLVLRETSGNNSPWYDLQDPTDGIRFYRRETYNDIGGIPVTMAPDVVALAKARLKGWQVKRFEETIAFKTRKTSASVKSMRKGFWMQGLRRYYLNYPLSILKKRPDLGFAILSGYMRGALNRQEKINDKDIRDYFRKTRPLEIVQQISRRM
jgi:glycosyltransferase involved in cell wall biosynthesis